MTNGAPNNAGATQTTTVIKADRPSWLLVALGGALIVLFMAGVIFSRAYGGETKETTPVASGTSAPTSVTEKTTKTKNAPSDTLLTAVLASGAALVLGGALYSRISTITLPGGVTVGLTTQEAKTTKDTVNEELKDKEPKDRLAAAEAAVEQVRQKKSSAGALELSDDDVKRVVKAAVQSYR
jgi:hypothetical protein